MSPSQNHNETMNQKELNELSDQELLAEAKKMRSSFGINAFIIGLFIGVVLYGFLKNNLGFFTLIPLFIVFKMFNKNKDHIALKKVLAERNLK